MQDQEANSVHSGWRAGMAASLGGTQGLMDTRRRRQAVAWGAVFLAGGALLVVMAILMLGSTLRLLAIIPCGWVLLMLALIDLRTLRLPNCLTLLLLAGGLLMSCIPLSTGPRDALSGTLLGYVVTAGIRWGYRFLARREGLGGGDVKLVAALGSWLGTGGLLPLLQWASLCGMAGWLAWVLLVHSRLVTGICAGSCGAARRQGGNPRTDQCRAGSMRLPFGPWLALVGWLMLLMSVNGH